MKDRGIANFWFGFVIAALATAWLYWLWRRNREVLPKPLIVTGRSDEQPEKTELTEPHRVRIELPPEPTQKSLMSTKEPDRLTKISGIGPTYERRLNEAGIYTYEQLTNVTPDRLREITSVTRWDPAEWIAEAHDLSTEK